MKKHIVTGKPARPAPQHGHGKGAGTTKPAPRHKPGHVPASVRIARHKAALKASRTRAKNAKKAAHHKKRGLAVTDGVACCAAEALAASLRLTGRAVSDEDVLELYWLTASDPDEGASIAATLDAAAQFGLAGVRPVTIRNVDSALMSGSGRGYLQLSGRKVGTKARSYKPALIFGVELPGGPHTLALDASGAVWSWGELHDPAQLQPGPVEEAWLVDWEA